MTSTLSFHSFFLVAVSQVVCLVFRYAWCVSWVSPQRSARADAVACCEALASEQGVWGWVLFFTVTELIILFLTLTREMYAK